jgi:uncharacterized tellurite resistance protein B-like protein
MKTDDFQEFLLKSAVTVMACDGHIDSNEIQEIRNMAESEIYFLGYDITLPLATNIAYIKEHGTTAVNEYLSSIPGVRLNSHQELLLIEVLIRTIEADSKIEETEIKFLQMVKSKLTTTEETIITKFPKQINYLIDFHNHGLHEEFTDEIKFEESN